MNPQELVQNKDITPAVVTNTTPINNVSMLSLTKPSTPISVPQPKTPTPPSQFANQFEGTIRQANDGIIRAQTQESEIRNDLLGRLLNQDTSSSQDVFNRAFDKQGGSDTLQKLTDANTRLAQLQGKFRTGAQAISGAEGQSKVFEGVQLNELSRQEAVEVGNQALVVQALQGNLESARQIALDTSNFAIEDRKVEMQNLLNQYDAISGVVQGQETQLLQQERDRVQKEFMDLENLQSTVNGAISSGGASVEEMQQLTNPNTTDEQKLAISQSIVARTTRQDRALETAIKNMEYTTMADAQSEAKKARESGILTSDQAKVATDLRKEVNNLQEVKATKELEPNIVALISALEKENGVGDISAINSFQRLAVDPGVAVREGDVALLQSAQSFGDKAFLKGQGLYKGDKLTPEAREQMKQLALDIYQARVDFTEDNIMPIRTMATEQGIDYNKYIGRPFSTVEEVQTRAGLQPTNVEDNYLNKIDQAFQGFGDDPYADLLGSFNFK